MSSITLTTGANVSGRLLARNGAVTLDSNSVTVCLPGICPVVTVNPETLPNGVIGSLYSQTVSATGGNAPYTFALSSGSLPPGLTLDTMTGLISGTPTSAGSFSFTVTATDANGCPGSRAYTIIITNPGCPVIVVNPATLPPGIIGTPYNQTISATGGAAPYTYAISAGALPNGLTLNGTSGIVSGTPTTAGQFSFTVTATDANGCQGSRLYSMVIPVVPNCPFITVNPPTLPAGIIGTPYSQTITATGGSAPYTFAVTGGALPNGLTLNSATGIISGTPTTAGEFNFVITATDGNGCPGSRAYVMVIPLAPVCPFITVNPPTLPTPVFGQFYSQTITATGGVTPYTFSVSTGALPTGLTLNVSTGVISGIPTSVGPASFVITATDANGCPGIRAYAFDILIPVHIAVPTLSNWALLMLTLLLAAGAMTMMARSRGA